MTVSQILITVVLVVGGIFAYDEFLAEKPGTEGAPAAVTSGAEEAPSPSSPPRTPPPPRLETQAIERILARLDGLESEVAKLRERPAQAIPDSGRSGGTSSPSYEGPGGSYEVPSAGEGEPYREEDVRQFRELLEAVETQRREERAVTMVENELQRLGVSLDERVRGQVIQATLEYREELRGVWSRASTSDTSPGERREEMEALRQGFQETIYSLVPSADAEKIVSRIGRYPGWNARAGGGLAPQGR